MKRNINVPNLLSFLRMLAAIPMWLLLSDGNPDWAFGVNLGALLTDFLDGWLAVKLNQATDLGKVLDPWADKVLHISIFLLFLDQYPELKWKIYGVIALAIVLVGLAGVKLYFRVQRRLGANWFGKTKLCFEGAAIIALFLGSPIWAGRLLVVALLFAVMSILGHLVIKERGKREVPK